MTPEERHAYKEGQTDARLDKHDDHFRTLNGSMEKNAEAITKLDKSTTEGFSKVADEVGLMNSHILGIQASMPVLQSVAALVLKQEEVDAAIAKNKRERQTRWERWRTTVAWCGGIAAMMIATFNFVLRIFFGT